MSLDVRRALLLYLERTRDFRSAQDLLFSVCSGGKGKKASLQSVSRWIKQAIFRSYESLFLLLPSNVQARSTRAVSASWAEFGGASIDEICRAATWSSPSMFVSHYRLDLSPSGENFGSSVLRSAVP